MKPWDEMSHRERLEQTFRDLKRKQLHRKRKAEEEAKKQNIPILSKGIRS